MQVQVHISCPGALPPKAIEAPFQSTATGKNTPPTTQPNPWLAAPPPTTQLAREEADLDFWGCPARVLHNRVRAFAGWPTTSGRFLLEGEPLEAAGAGGGGWVWAGLGARGGWTEKGQRGSNHSRV